MRFSHVGLCVSDGERSKRFYTEALGFSPTADFRVGAEFARLMELDDVALRSQFLERDGTTIELLTYDAPRTIGDAHRRSMNQLGLTHLSFRVDDVDGVAALVAQHGGTVHHETRTRLGDGDAASDFVYCSDPDGIRIELMCLPS